MKHIIIGDTHYGEKNDSEKYNNQLNGMIDFSIDYAKKNKITSCIQAGDFFHNRHKINVSSLNYGIEGARKLSEQFGKENFHVLVGNHCIYHKDRLDVNSLKVIEPYATIIEKPTSLGNILLTPWLLTNEDWDNIVTESKNHDFLIAHLELNGFKMNDHYVMEHGMSHKELKGYDKVITGHYHSYQQQENVYYIGTPVPIGMSEANEDHGFFVLDDETGELEMIVYDKVKVVSINYLDVESLDDLDPENTSVRIEFPDDLDDEELISEIQDHLAEMNFNEVKVKYKGNKAKELLAVEVEDIEEVENIDLVVKNFMSSSIEIEGIDKATLIKYYDQAIEKDEEENK
ncbi:MAG: hypothetical protein PF440_05340 [Thiomicrorhabdus sp.]|jgi:DNA repair exonuclease SbcCD nuclease subunit|nr:hypothetical protein [Thiomicrorhabdus sp.]